VIEQACFAFAFPPVSLRCSETVQSKVSRRDQLPFEGGVEIVLVEGCSTTYNQFFFGRFFLTIISVRQSVFYCCRKCPVLRVILAVVRDGEREE